MVRYNEARRQYGLDPAKTFDDISDNKEVPPPPSMQNRPAQRGHCPQALLLGALSRMHASCRSSMEGHCVRICRVAFAVICHVSPSGNLEAASLGALHVAHVLLEQGQSTPGWWCGQQRSIDVHGMSWWSTAMLEQELMLSMAACMRACSG